MPGECIKTCFSTQGTDCSAHCGSRALRLTHSRQHSGAQIEWRASRQAAQPPQKRSTRARAEARVDAGDVLAEQQPQLAVRVQQQELEALLGDAALACARAAGRQPTHVSARNRQTIEDAVGASLLVLHLCRVSSPVTQQQHTARPRRPPGSRAKRKLCLPPDTLQCSPPRLTRTAIHEQACGRDKACMAHAIATCISIPCTAPALINQSFGGRGNGRHV